MFCFLKSSKNPTPKPTSIDKAFAAREHAAQINATSWTPLTAGPYLIPVTRWVE
jgi:hypothetical protein